MAKNIKTDSGLNQPSFIPGWSKSIPEGAYILRGGSQRKPKYRLMSAEAQELHHFHLSDGLRMMHTWQGLPVYKAGNDPVKKRQKAQRKAEKLRVESELADRLLKEWCGAYSSVALAEAELVRHCNRYAKALPKYKNRSSAQDLLLNAIYAMKDSWICRNKHLVTDHAKSMESVNTWVDWDELHFCADCSGEWQDADDFTRTEIVRFYAYTFDIESVEFRFHSMQCLFNEDKLMPANPDCHGSAQPLNADEQRFTDAEMQILCKVLATRWGKVSKVEKEELVDFEESPVARSIQSGDPAPSTFKIGDTIYYQGQTWEIIKALHERWVVVRHKDIELIRSDRQLLEG